jgi:hypothetical protein
MSDVKLRSYIRRLDSIFNMNHLILKDEYGQYKS